MFREQTLQTLLYADVKKIGTVLRPRSATNSGKFLTYQVKYREQCCRHDVHFRTKV